MKLTKERRYDTEFGTFIISTYRGKARRRNNYTGRTEWKEIQSTGGKFADYPDAVEFFLYREGDDTYVSSSQGDNSREWVESVHATTYNEALRKVDDEVVRCFQDYYGDSSIR